MASRQTVLIALAGLVLCCLVKCSWAQRELCQAFIQECARDEFSVGQKRMTMFHKEKNWHDANKHCESLGMRLLTTPTKNEVDLVKTYLNSRTWENRPDVQFWNLWLGATDEEEDGTWKWTASGQALTYTTWAKDEPNGLKIENCLELKLLYFEETWWNDAKCHIRKRYICEMEDGGLNK